MNLSAHKSKARPEFDQKLAEVLDQTEFQFAFAGVGA